MGKIFLIVLFLATLVCARENPFEPVSSSEKMGKATNIKEKREDLKAEKFTLPSSARVLKKVILTYQNIDGSISEKEFKIDKNIDWHFPLVISHNLPKAEPIA